MLFETADLYAVGLIFMVLCPYFTATEHLYWTRSNGGRFRFLPLEGLRCVSPHQQPCRAFLLCNFTGAWGDERCELESAQKGVLQESAEGK
jgi:hypothetical protein